MDFGRYDFSFLDDPEVQGGHLGVWVIPDFVV